MLEIIFIIAAIVGFIHLNSKITSVQNKLSKLEKGSGVPIPYPPPTPAQPISVSTLQQVGQVQAQPLTSSVIPPVPSLAPMPPIQATSSEELGGRWLGKIGIAAVLIGISFFLKYAFDTNLIGIGGRIALGIIAGLVLIGIGMFLRAKYRMYSDVLMGGGIGVLYLTIYASFAFYHLVSEPIAFALIALVTLVSVILSIVDDAITLAVLGIIGGFVTPMLMASGGNNFIEIFTYTLLLDIGVLLVSIYKRWLKLNYIAFVGTIIMVLSWYGRFYTNEQLGPVFFFVTLYFFIFLVATIAHHLFRKEQTNNVDLGLITVNALGYFGMSYLLLNPDYHAVMGFFSCVLALIYFIVSYIAWMAHPEDKALNFYLPGLAILFLTLAIPLQLTGEWIALAWFVESILITLIATSLRRLTSLPYAIVIYGIGVIKLFADMGWRVPQEYIPFLNREFFFYMVAVVTAYILASIFLKNKEMELMGTKVSTLAGIFVVIANILTISALTNEVSRIYPPGQQASTAISILWAVYASVLIGIGFAMRSKLLRLFGLIFFFITAIKIFVDVWSLGELYRVISSIVFGIIALIGSFAYAKYKHRLKEIMYE